MISIALASDIDRNFLMATTPETRFCGTEIVTPGHSPDFCRNVISTSTAKCAAGHAVPAIGSTPGAYLVPSSHPSIVTSLDKLPEFTAESHPTTIDFDEIESFLATTSLDSAPGGAIHEPSVAELDAEAAAEDMARAEEIRGQFIRYYFVNSEAMTYEGTIRGQRQRLSEGGTAPFLLDRFILLGPDKVLAYGDYGLEHSLYLESKCQSESCARHAYTRLHLIQIVPEEGASEELVRRSRQSTLGNMIADADARAKHALCDHHRVAAGSQGNA